MHLGEDRTVLPGLVMLLVYRSRHRHEARIGEAGELPVGGPGSTVREADQLSALEAALRLAEQGPRTRCWTRVNSASARPVRGAEVLPISGRLTPESGTISGVRAFELKPRPRAACKEYLQVRAEARVKRPYSFPDADRAVFASPPIFS